MKNRTTLVIAHSLATEQCADRISVFNDGKAAAMGRDLVAPGGLYAHLANLQFTPFAAK